MPIVVRCPNGACNQPLQVPDQYAGMQGKCPQCGTLVTFPAAGSAPLPPVPLPPPLAAPAPQGAGTYAMAAPPAPPPAVAYAPPPPAPAAYPPAAPGAYPQQPAAGYAPPPAAPASPPMTTEQLIDLIAMPAGLFFVFLLFLACFMPWVSMPLDVPGFPRSGAGRGDAGIFVVLCLLVGAAAGLTYLLKPMLTRVVAVAAGFGTFSFFVMLGAMMEYSGFTGAGVWVGLFGAMGVAGAFITLSLYHPVESKTADAVKLSPLLKRHAALFLSIAIGGGLGFIYLVLSLITRTAMMPM